MKPRNHIREEILALMHAGASVTEIRKMGYTMNSILRAQKPLKPSNRKPAIATSTLVLGTPRKKRAGIWNISTEERQLERCTSCGFKVFDVDEQYKTLRLCRACVVREETNRERKGKWKV